MRVLGLPLRRPNTFYAFRMLCRHNKLVQEFGKVKDPDEIARRERVWAEALARIEKESGGRPPRSRRTSSGGGSARSST